MPEHKRLPAGDAWKIAWFSKEFKFSKPTIMNHAKRIGIKPTMKKSTGNLPIAYLNRKDAELLFSCLLIERKLRKMRVAK